MSVRKTTVTHPDGTVSTRGSKTMHYTHAIEVGPADAEKTAAMYDRLADAQDAKADALEQLLDNSPTVKLYGRTYQSANPMMACEARLVGAGADDYLRTWCSREGMTEHGYPEVVTEKVFPYLVRVGRKQVADRRESAAKLRERAAGYRAAGVVADDNAWGVYRWSTRRDLAEKALREAEKVFAERGCVVRVVAVD